MDPSRCTGVLLQGSTYIDGKICWNLTEVHTVTNVRNIAHLGLTRCRINGYVEEV